MGAINIKHTGSGSDVTLSSDGSSLLLDGTAIGGAALELYAENPSSPTTPSATGTNSVAIGSDAQATATNGSVALGTSTRATGNANVAIGFQANVAGVGALGAGYTANAGSSFSTALGYNAVTATGSNATALTNSYASGTDSFAAAIANNTSTYGSTGVNSVAIGYLARATTTGATAIGYLAGATGTSSLALGRQALANGNYSTALGYESDTQNIFGKLAYSSGAFDSKDCQAGIYVLRREFSSVLTTDGATPSTSNQVKLPTNSAFAFHGTVVSLVNPAEGGSGDASAWKVEGLIKRIGGVTTLVNSAITIIHASGSAALTLSADTTNGALQISVTGGGERTAATIYTTEILYDL